MSPSLQSGRHNNCSIFNIIFNILQKLSWEMKPYCKINKAHLTIITIITATRFMRFVGKLQQRFSSVAECNWQAVRWTEYTKHSWKWCLEFHWVLDHAIQSQLQITHNFPSKLFLKLTLCVSRLSLNCTDRHWEFKARVNTVSRSSKETVHNIEYLIMQDWCKLLWTAL